MTTRLDWIKYDITTGARWARAWAFVGVLVGLAIAIVALWISGLTWYSMANAACGLIAAYSGSRYLIGSRT